MKVAFFTHYAALYGANRSLLNLIDGLKSYHVESFVVTPEKGDLIDSLKERNIPYIIVPHQWWSSERLPDHHFKDRISYFWKWHKNAINRLIINLRLISSIRKQIAAWDVDLLYSNSSVIPIGAIMSLVMNKPHIWHLREFGDLDYNLSFDWGTPIFNIFLRRANAQICISQAIRSFYRNGLRSNKCHVVYNGVATRDEMDKFHSFNIHALNRQADFVFAIVGLIQKNKGQDTAIRALSILKSTFPSVRLIIAGNDTSNGNYINELKKLAVLCNVENEVSFIGYTPNPYDIYLKADAILMCSKHEALGRVSIEAMTACKPVIGHKSGGTAEIVENNVNGFLYEGDHTELASCMQRLLDNPSLARDMGEKGWQMASKFYSIETYAGHIHKILVDVMKR